MKRLRMAAAVAGLIFIPGCYGNFGYNFSGSSLFGRLHREPTSCCECGGGGEASAAPCCDGPPLGEPGGPYPPPPGGPGALPPPRLDTMPQAQPTPAGPVSRTGKQ